MAGSDAARTPLTKVLHPPGSAQPADRGSDRLPSLPSASAAAEGFEAVEDGTSSLATIPGASRAWLSGLSRPSGARTPPAPSAATGFMQAWENKGEEGAMSEGHAPVRWLREANSRSGAPHEDSGGGDSNDRMAQGRTTPHASARRFIRQEMINQLRKGRDGRGRDGTDGRRTLGKICVDARGALPRQRGEVLRTDGTRSSLELRGEQNHHAVVTQDLQEVTGRLLSRSGGYHRGLQRELDQRYSHQRQPRSVHGSMEPLPDILPDGVPGLGVSGNNVSS